MSDKTRTGLPVALSIAGSDSGGSAGIQADLLTFAAHGVFGTTAITATTAQNPEGVTGIQVSDPKHLCDQVAQVLGYFPVGAIKIGMLADLGIVRAVAGLLRERAKAIPIVLDPVMVATSGAMLLPPESVDAIREELIPLATIVTPNLDEGQVLLGGRKLENTDELRPAMEELLETYQRPFLLKGGHLPGNEVVDLLGDPGGTILEFRHPRIPNVDTHGGGCTLSSAIAARLARGETLVKAVEGAVGYLHRGMTEAMSVGGRTYINHSPPGDI